MSERWDRHFLHLAQVHAEMSKDPSTKVGAVIVGPDREIRSVGFNGFPRGVKDTPARLQDRDTKLDLIVHGEMNAILAAARVGVPLKGCTMYVAATDKSGAVWGGAVWGGPPCIRCSVEVIQAGITEIVSWPLKTAPSRWHASCAKALEVLREAGVVYREIGQSALERRATEKAWAAAWMVWDKTPTDKNGLPILEFPTIEDYQAYEERIKKRWDALRTKADDPDWLKRARDTGAV